MKRRGFLTALGALCTTAVLPTIPSIPIVDPRIVYKLALNSMYGKFYGGRYEEQRVLYADTDGVFTTDICSAYPVTEYERTRAAWKKQC